MKTLIDKLRKVGRGVKKGLWVATAVASIWTAGCNLCGPDPEPVNYAPVASLSVTPQSVEVNSPVNLELTGTDEDGNDDIIEYKVDVDKGADGTIEETITSPNPINQSWSSDYVGNVKIQGKVTDSQGAVGKATPITINVYPSPAQDYVDISGRLEDCENDGIGRQGIVKVYNALDNSLIGEEHLVNGNFSITLDKLVLELSDGVIIKAITGTSSNPTSYVRTKTFPAGDVNVGNIRVVPYPTFDTGDSNPAINDIDYQRFKTFMNEINASYAGLRRFDLSILEGIEIIDIDPLGSGRNFLSSYTDSQGNVWPTEQDFIKNKIINPNDIRLYVEGRVLNVQKDNFSSTKHYSTSRGYIEPYLGWIIVAPSNISNSETEFFWSLDDDRIKRARIDLGVVNDTVPTHEFGHAFIASNPWTNGHSTILLNPFTIMTATNLKSPPPGDADIKASHIVYESSYQLWEKLDNILGTSF